MPKRRKKTEKQKLKEKLWELCKTIVRKRDGNTCFICGKGPLAGGGWHTGHLIPSSTCGGYLRYDLRNLHSSCYNCNINLGGNGAKFARRVEEVYSKEFLDSIFADLNHFQKTDVLFFKEKIEEYKPLTELSKEELIEHTKKIYEDKTTC